MKDRDNYNIFGNGNDQSKESSNKANIKYSIFSGKEIDRPIKIENKKKDQILNQINENIQPELKEIENKDDDLSGKEFKTQILKKTKKKKNHLYKSVNLNLDENINVEENINPNQEDKKQLYNDKNEENDNFLINNKINYNIDNNDNINKDNNNKRDNDANKNENNINENSNNNANNKENNNFTINFKIQNDDDLAYKEKEKEKENSKDINSQEIKNSKQIRKNSYDKKQKNIEEEKKKKFQQENLAQVNDQLKCYICFDIIKKPRMCKYCNRLACEQCLISWFKSKTICGFCKKKTKLEEMLTIPSFDENTFNYLYNQIKMESNKFNNSELSENGQKEESTFYDKNYKFDTKEDNRMSKCGSNICEKHDREYEYYCVDCKQNLCSNCLLFFEKSSLIHKSHVIVKISNNQCKEELIKLNGTKKNIDDLISLLNLKIRELEIEKNQNIVYIDDIKKNLNDKYEKKLTSLKDENNILENKREECTNFLETLPYTLKNIIELNDYGQGEKILEHIKKINILDINNNNHIDFKNNFIESFKTEEKEFILPENIKSNEEQIIYEESSNDFIPNYSLKYTFKIINQETKIMIILDHKNNNKTEDKEKFYGFIIFKYKNYNSEFVKLENKSLSKLNQYLLQIKINTNNFIKFKDERNKIRFKFYILKYFKK